MRYPGRRSNCGHVLRLSVSIPGYPRSSLWEVSIDDGRVRRLLPGWNPSEYACCGNWTPDGKYYVFQSGSNIWAMREKGLGTVQFADQSPIS